MSSGLKCLSQVYKFPSWIWRRKFPSTTLSRVKTFNNSFLQVSLLLSVADGTLKILIPWYIGFRDTGQPTMEQFVQAYFKPVKFQYGSPSLFFKCAPWLSRDWVFFRALTILCFQTLRSMDYVFQLQSAYNRKYWTKLFVNTNQQM